MVRGRFLSLLLLCALAAGLLVFTRQKPAGAGEENKEAVLRLSLPQIIERAVARSPETGEARSQVLAARSSLEEVEAAWYPRLETTALVGPVDDAEEPIIVNNRIHDPSPGLSFSTIGVFGRLDFRATQPLYTFGKLANATRAARSGVAASKLEIPRTENEIALQVTRLYYALILARSGIDAADDADNFFDDARKRIRRLLDAGSPNVSESDLYMLDAFRAGVARSRAEANKGVEVATYALRAMLEIPPGTRLEVAAEPLGIKKGQRAALKRFVAAAFLNRPEFKQLGEALKAREYSLAAAVSDLYPSLFVALEASLAGAPGRDHLDNPYIDDEFNHAYAGVVAGAEWEFDFGIKKARIEAARADYNRLRSARQKAEMNIPIQVARAYQEILEWEKSAASYRKAAVASRKWVVSAFADFDMGIGSAENLLRAIEKYGENQGDYIEALYNYNTAVADLKYATGLIRQRFPGLTVE